MPGATDVIFLDRNWRVLELLSALEPWRWALAPRRTSAVLLLAAGRACSAGLERGMSLSQDTAARAQPFVTTVLRRIDADRR
jgi:uncharacterized membrane protein (UPF0127 family)